MAQSARADNSLGDYMRNADKQGRHAMCSALPLSFFLLAAREATPSADPSGVMKQVRWPPPQNGDSMGSRAQPAERGVETVTKDTSLGVYG